MWGSLQQIVRSFKFCQNWLNDFGVVGVKIRFIPISLANAYMTACRSYYRTSNVIKLTACIAVSYMTVYLPHEAYIRAIVMHCLVTMAYFDFCFLRKCK